MAKEITLRYGANPHQTPARVFMKEGELPFLIPVHGQKVSVDYVDKIEAFFREREKGD